MPFAVGMDAAGEGSSDDCRPRGAASGHAAGNCKCQQNCCDRPQKFSSVSSVAVPHGGDSSWAGWRWDKSGGRILWGESEVNWAIR